MKLPYLLLMGIPFGKNVSILSRRRLQPWPAAAVTGGCSEAHPNESNCLGTLTQAKDIHSSRVLSELI
ncbi:hypothetical protein TNCV_1585611 [Trichonephila clavipes]|nr:hypothetical protein TNCV_1585611 [Trichonephila clavipes]